MIRHVSTLMARFAAIIALPALIASCSGRLDNRIDDMVDMLPDTEGTVVAFSPADIIASAGGSVDDEGRADIPAALPSALRLVTGAHTGPALTLLSNKGINYRGMVVFEPRGENRTVAFGAIAREGEFADALKDSGLMPRAIGELTVYADSESAVKVVTDADGEWAWALEAPTASDAAAFVGAALKGDSRLAEWKRDYLRGETSVKAVSATPGWARAINPAATAMAASANLDGQRLDFSASMRDASGTDVVMVPDSVAINPAMTGYLAPGMDLTVAVCLPPATDKIAMAALLTGEESDDHRSRATLGLTAGVLATLHGTVIAGAGVRPGVPFSPADPECYNILVGAEFTEGKAEEYLNLLEEYCNGYRVTYFRNGNTLRAGLSDSLTAYATCSGNALIASTRPIASGKPSATTDYTGKWLYARVNIAASNPLMRLNALKCGLAGEMSGSGSCLNGFLEVNGTADTFIKALLPAINTLGALGR